VVKNAGELMMQPRYGGANAGNRRLHHRLLASGLRATINTDDPAYFGGYIAENFRAAAASRRLDKAQLVSLARNSFLGAFLDEGTRQSYLRKLDEFASA
jgi:adenosine deaminase